MPQFSALGAGKVPFRFWSRLAVAFSAVSLFYLQVLKRVYVLPATDESPIRAGFVTTGVLVVISAAVLVLGCLPALLQNWIGSFYR